MVGCETVLILRPPRIIDFCVTKVTANQIWFYERTTVHCLISSSLDMQTCSDQLLLLIAQCGSVGPSESFRY